MTWLTWIPRLIGFGAWYVWALVTSNVAVVRDVLTPGQDSTPGIVTLRTRCRSEREVTLISALISLTPGTLTLGASRQAVGTSVGSTGWTIVVHGMYHPEREDLRADVADMESRMLAAVRREGFRP